jgi:hypothetical protein
VEDGVADLLADGVGGPQGQVGVDLGVDQDVQGPPHPAGPGGVYRLDALDRRRRRLDLVDHLRVDPVEQPGQHVAGGPDQHPDDHGRQQQAGQRVGGRPAGPGPGDPGRGGQAGQPVDP